MTSSLNKHLVENRTNLFKYEILFYQKSSLQMHRNRLLLLHWIEKFKSFISWINTLHHHHHNSSYTIFTILRTRIAFTRIYHIEKHMSTWQVFILVDDFYLTDQNISHVQFTCKSKHRRNQFIARVTFKGKRCEKCLSREWQTSGKHINGCRQIKRQ